MKAELKAKWVEALRSGKYQQGTNYLKRTDTPNNEPVYCCLGVLCDISGKGTWNQHNEFVEEDGQRIFTKLDDKLLNEFGFGPDTQTALMRMNDGSYGVTSAVPPKNFNAIADFIEREIWAEPELAQEGVTNA